MTADASQPPLSLGWFLILGVPAFAVCVGVWLRAGWESMRRADDALDVYEDDEPVPYLPVDSGDRCTHPDCEKARELHRQRIRRQLSLARVHAFTASRGRAHWSQKDDAEFAEFARSHGGA